MCVPFRILEKMGEENDIRWIKPVATNNNKELINYLLCLSSGILLFKEKKKLSGHQYGKIFHVEYQRKRFKHF